MFALHLTLGLLPKRVVVSLEALVDSLAALIVVGSLGIKIVEIQLDAPRAAARRTILLDDSASNPKLSPCLGMLRRWRRRLGLIWLNPRLTRIGVDVLWSEVMRSIRRLNFIWSGMAIVFHGPHIFRSSGNALNRSAAPALRLDYSDYGSGLDHVAIKDPHKDLIARA